MLDDAKQIDSVQRKVGKSTLNGDDAHVVTMTQTHSNSVDDVWDAVTNPERLPKWFAPVTGDLRLGGKYQVQGNANGTVEKCDPSKSFTATWEFGGQFSRIEVRLEADPNGGTRFELEHVQPADDHWAKFGPSATGVGWDMAFMGLATHLAGQEIDSHDGWAASPNAKQFIERSSQGWCDANVASGADPAEAQAMADRTTAFYKGEEV